MSKTTVIHHSADFDGLFCREIARKFLPEAELIGWDYGDPHLEFPKEGQVYVLDLSPDCFWESPLRAEFIGRLTWIDHHKSAIDKYDGEGWVHEPAGKDSFGLPYNEFWRRGHEVRKTPPTPGISGYRIDGVAACRLAWQWFTIADGNTPRRGPEIGIPIRPAGVLPMIQDYKNRDVHEPYAVRLAGEYDIWDKRDPLVELFQHGLRSRPLDNWVWSKLLDNTVPAALKDSGMDQTESELMVGALLDSGRAVQYAQTKQNEDIITHYGFTIQFEGLTFLACNHARYNSLLFTAGLKPEHDACFGFKYDNGQWSVSLYHAPGKEHHDLSKIAVKYGGGGHRGACGFRTAELPFLKH